MTPSNIANINITLNNTNVPINSMPMSFCNNTSVGPVTDAFNIGSPHASNNVTPGHVITQRKAEGRKVGIFLVGQAEAAGGGNGFNNQQSGIFDHNIVGHGNKLPKDGGVDVSEVPENINTEAKDESK